MRMQQCIQQRQVGRWRRPTRRHAGCTDFRAFTLVELLAVIVVMSVMMGLLAVSIHSLAAQSARKGAVNQILNTFEQVRVVALQNATNAYVGLADKDTFPDGNEAARYRSYIVFRDRLPTDTPSSDNPNASRFVLLTGWRTLPRGISFVSGYLQNGDVLENNLHILKVDPAEKMAIQPGDRFPGIGSGLLVCIQFNQTGMIRKPRGRLDLYLYEGRFHNRKDLHLGNATGSMLEKFTFARFTGRIRHEVSCLN
jgi:prepilin-type N-terminal cleavage/methylation domain-containing protein